MRNAALKASAASDCRPKYRAKNRCLTRPARRLRRMPAATNAAERVPGRSSSVDVIGGCGVERAARALHQERLDEAVEIAVEDAIDVAHLFFRPVVFHHPVWMKHVAADLAAERNPLLHSPDLIESR